MKIVPSKENQLAELNWELTLVRRQHDDCSFWINNGNWSVYPDALSNRKERLKEYKKNNREH